MELLILVPSLTLIGYYLCRIAIALEKIARWEDD